MKDLAQTTNQIFTVLSFDELVSTAFHGEINAICWSRKLIGDFSEIVHKTEMNENIRELCLNELRELHLSDQGNAAREIILNDYNLLKAHGAAPILNLINCYERDDSFFTTDVYSFHVDRSPIPTDTFLCTYFGDSSEIIPNSQAVQKILVPEIRAELKKIYGGLDEGFESFLEDYFFNLHYQVKPNAQPISLGNGNLWRLAIEHPQSNVQPCIHRAPNEISGQTRLMLIC